MQLDDPGHDLSLVGTAAGLTFNLPATLAADLTGSFKPGVSPTAAPATPPVPSATPPMPSATPPMPSATP